MTLRIAIIGPTKAGKTVYAASLLRAAFTAGRAQRTTKVRPAVGCVESQALLDKAARIIQGDRLPGTSAVTHYRMVADLPGSLIAELGRESMEITLVDPPGGDCIPPPTRTIHPAVLEAAVEADGLMLVVPADDALRPHDLGARITAFFAAVRRRRELPVHKPLYARIALVLTMAEVGVMELGPAARAALDRLSPRAAAVRCLGAEAVAAVAAAAARGGEWYSLVSVYGFTEQGGPAVVRAADGWRFAAPGGFEEWQPYRVFEPLEFLARGIVWQEEPVR